MNLLIVGDVHGCYYTFQSLLEEHWHPETEILIQVGDLIDRGKHTPLTVEYCRTLSERYPERAIFLKGNHEYEMIEHDQRGPNTNWLRQCGKETLMHICQYQTKIFNASLVKILYNKYQSKSSELQGSRDKSDIGP